MDQTFILILLLFFFLPFVLVHSQVTQKLFKQTAVAKLSWAPFENATNIKTQSGCSVYCLQKPDTCSAFSFKQPNCSLAKGEASIKLPLNSNPKFSVKIWRDNSIVPVPHVLLHTGTTYVADFSLDLSNSPPITYPTISASFTSYFGYLNNTGYITLLTIYGTLMKASYGDTNFVSSYANYPRSIDTASVTWVGKRIWILNKSGSPNCFSSLFCSPSFLTLASNSVFSCQNFCQDNILCYSFYFQNGMCYLISSGQCWSSSSSLFGPKFCDDYNGYLLNDVYQRTASLPRGVYPNPDLVQDLTLASADDDTGLVFFGHYTSGSTTTYNKLVWKFSFTNDSWTRMADSPITRYTGIAQRVTLSNGTDVVVIMGEQNGVSMSESNTWLYNIGSDKWIRTSFALPAFSVASSVVVNNRLFYIGNPPSPKLTTVSEWNEFTGWNLYKSFSSAFGKVVPIIYNTP